MRSQSLLRGILTLLIVYFSTFGMTFNGILIPELRWMTLFILIAGLVTWRVTHYREKWLWYRTPLDLVLVGWGIVIGVSLLANVDVWRRSATAIWFVLGYGLLWYMASDWLSNKRLQRETLIDAGIMGGLVIVFFGYLQFLMAFTQNGDIARVGSLVGNPNSLGAFLLLLLTLIIGRALMLKNKLGRRLLWVYALLTGALLGITFSRGAWIGMAVSLFILFGLNLSPQFWAKLRPTTSRAKAVWVMGGVVILAVGIGATLVLVQSFDLAGRSLGLRTEIYTNAITIFEQSPITGHGLFTFGREFAEEQSQPPRQPHSHAHNGVLLVMAELGLMGLLLLVISVGVVFLIMRQNWREASPQGRSVLAIGIAGSIGFGVHHLLDFPAMMPLIALCGLMPLLLALIPENPKPLKMRWRTMGHPMAMAIASIGFIGVGAWSSAIYGDYTAILARPFGEDADMTYAQAGDALQGVIDRDPAMAWYRNQQAYLYGLAGEWEKAIVAYEIFLSQEPSHAIGWANLAHAYSQLGQYDRAIEAQERAVALTSDFYPFRFILGTYLEANGDIERARTVYESALQPSLTVWSVWEATPLRQSVLATAELSDSHYLIIALDEGVDDNLLALWQGSQFVDEQTSRASMLWLVVALRTGQPVDSAQLIAQAKARSQTVSDETWVLWGEMQLAFRNRDNDALEALTARLEEKITPQFSKEDIAFATNVPYFQFLSTSIPRQLLPDIFNPLPDAALSRLLD
ncbi:MAG: O-antigen ligase family protein [bacterium]|nr:O-antigen ligase family protein [bacterium]